MTVPLSTVGPPGRAPSSTGLSTARVFGRVFVQLFVRSFDLAGRGSAHQPFLISWVSSVTWS